MNATPHTVIGYSCIKLVGANPFGFALAFCSHLLLDYVNESKGITNTKERLIYDVLPSFLTLILLYYFRGSYEAWLFVLGSVFGNLPDLIDKKLYLTIILPSKYKSTNYLHWQKPIINPSPFVTKIIGFVLCILALLIF